jgi:hypothetical protein
MAETIKVSCWKCATEREVEITQQQFKCEKCGQKQRISKLNVSSNKKEIVAKTVPENKETQTPLASEIGQSKKELQDSTPAIPQIPQHVEQDINEAGEGKETRRTATATVSPMTLPSSATQTLEIKKSEDKEVHHCPECGAIVEKYGDCTACGFEITWIVDEDEAEEIRRKGYA